MNLSSVRSHELISLLEHSKFSVHPDSLPILSPNQFF
uniref:Uncharacterized protein n=1 Tax=Lepeophtheirus salmonis TaxID=72036 RepID=A0A0K2TQW9_LEPSM